MNQPYSNPITETLLFPELELRYAGFWERVGACLLDGLILMIPNITLQYLLSPAQALIVNLAVSCLYYAVQESGAAQATIGKKALGLKVTSLEGDRISFGKATGRYFGMYLSGLILCMGYLMMLWNDRRQTLHDQMAATLVVKA